MLLGFHLPACSRLRVEPQPWTSPTNGRGDQCLADHRSEGIVTIRVPHTEMGQGALTSVAMMIAEEFHVDWSRIQAVFADPNRHFNNVGIQ